MGKVLLQVKTPLKEGKSYYARREVEWAEAIHAGDICDWSDVFTIRGRFVTGVYHHFAEGYRLVYLEDVDENLFQTLIASDPSWKEVLF